MARLSLVLLAFTLFCEAAAAAPEDDIRARLNQWPQDLRGGNLAGACSLFAPDLVASYPGTQDRNFHEMCRHLSEVMQDKDKAFDYAPPAIEEVIVDKDIAIVRLIWTLTIVDRKTQEKEVVKEKGLDVFQRQPDGVWKIRISYAYPNGNS